jgi:hypothetical protein
MHGETSLKPDWHKLEIDPKFFEDTQYTKNTIKQLEGKKEKVKEVLNGELGEEEERNERKKVLSSADCQSLKS